jgi:lactoylglutathione lyase
MPKAKKARAVGFNHIALEVGDIDEALAFYGRLFEFKLRGKSLSIWGISSWLCTKAGGMRRMMGGILGLVVDDKEAVRGRAERSRGQGAARALSRFPRSPGQPLRDCRV